MRLKIFYVSIIVLLLSVNNSFSRQLEIIESTSKEDAYYSIKIRGAFNESAVAGPNDIMFSYVVTPKEISKYVIPVSWDEYIMVGRTGEKTFDIKHSKKYTENSKSDILNIYFEENMSFQIKILPLFSDCSSDEKVEIEMLRLSGPNLEYRIILPECLKYYIENRK